jgi:hypothetical protein
MAELTIEGLTANVPKHPNPIARISHGFLAGGFRATVPVLPDDPIEEVRLALGTAVARNATHCLMLTKGDVLHGDSMGTEAHKSPGRMPEALRLLSRVSVSARTSDCRTDR